MPPFHNDAVHKALMEEHGRLGKEVVALRREGPLLVQEIQEAIEAKQSRMADIMRTIGEHQQRGGARRGAKRGTKRRRGAKRGTKRKRGSKRGTRRSSH